MTLAVPFGVSKVANTDEPLWDRLILLTEEKLYKGPNAGKSEASSGEVATHEN